MCLPVHYGRCSLPFCDPEDRLTKGTKAVPLGIRPGNVGVQRNPVANSVPPLGIYVYSSPAFLFCMGLCRSGYTRGMDIMNDMPRYCGLSFENSL